MADKKTPKPLPARYSVADLRGIIPALQRPDSGDFDAQIREAFEDGVDRIVAELEARLPMKRDDAEAYVEGFGRCDVVM